MDIPCSFFYLTINNFQIVSAKKVHAYLQKKGQPVEIQNILSSEARVFEALGYEVCE